MYRIGLRYSALSTDGQYHRYVLENSELTVSHTVAPQSDELLCIACFLDPCFQALPFESHSKQGAIYTTVQAQLVKLLAVDIADQPSERQVAEGKESKTAKRRNQQAWVFMSSYVPATGVPPSSDT